MRVTSNRSAGPAVFAALGDETRLQLVHVLAGGAALSITQLTEGTTVTRQAITKHLQVLAAAGLVRHTRHGREQLWELEGERLREAERQLERIAAEWESALARLKAHLGE